MCSGDRLPKRAVHSHVAVRSKCGRSKFRVASRATHKRGGWASSRCARRCPSSPPVLSSSHPFAAQQGSRPPRRPPPLPLLPPLQKRMGCHCRCCHCCHCWRCRCCRQSSSWGGCCQRGPWRPAQSLTAPALQEKQCVRSCTRKFCREWWGDDLLVVALAQGWPGSACCDSCRCPEKAREVCGGCASCEGYQPGSTLAACYWCICLTPQLMNLGSLVPSSLASSKLYMAAIKQHLLADCPSPPTPCRCAH